MSRSGYTDDYPEDRWAYICWRGAVASAVRGQRGQAMLRDMLAALDALPEKRLAAGSLVTEDGECCTLGALGRARGLEMDHVDPDDRRAVADLFGCAESLAAEIMYMNDDFIDGWDWVDVEICGPMRPHYPDWGRHTRSIRVTKKDAAEQRWLFMRDWVAQQIASKGKADDD